MNKTKKTLIIISSVFLFVEAGLSVIGLFCTDLIFRAIENNLDAFIENYYTNIPAQIETIKAIYFVSIVYIFLITLTGAMLLTFSIANNQLNQKLYIAGAIFTILAGVISIPSILIYVSFGIKDIDNTTTSNENKNNSNEVDSIERKIKLLRDLKNRKEISEEEFKRLLSDIIEKKE